MIDFTATLAPRQARSRKTHARILDATERLLNADPYGEISMPGIAGEAGISVGGLYGRFSSRDTLLEAVHARYQERRDAFLRGRFEAATDSDLATRVEVFVGTFVELHSKNAGVLRSFIIRHWLAAEGPTESVLQDVRDHKSQIAEFLCRGREACLTPTCRSAIRRAVEYVISISKEQIVVSPDNLDDLRRLDLDQLCRDLREIAWLMMPEKMKMEI